MKGCNMMQDAWRAGIRVRTGAWSGSAAM